MDNKDVFTKSTLKWGLVGTLILLSATECLAAPGSGTSDAVVSINTEASSEFSKGDVFAALKISTIMSSLVFLPSLLMAVTCFPRIAIILSITRQALGTAQTPPNQVLLGLALFLTFAIMGPQFTEIYETALVPYADDALTFPEALDAGFKPLRNFMLPLTREEDIQLFLEITKTEFPESPDTISAKVLIPAFVLSELNTAFQIAFLIYIPFLVLDMIISSVLTSMSMITLPPTVISLPIKLLLFVMIDGWSLIISNLVKTYGG
ncbi:MAG TPA: flagellar type III secretion system pore protein FliP [Oligoflexia bacterium]|nr:flagellar type III secretion system pore protein FliP [Oligoflexia bacterium]HMP48778.1 flagellar type III secretion system pore protein FliP [Oligoflexia bacterium]